MIALVLDAGYCGGSAALGNEMATLILFDVDGTLTATNVPDAKCYAAAFAHIFGTPLPTIDWGVYVHCTDSGIIHEVIEKERGHNASQEELKAFERRFVFELEQEFADAPDGFQEIPGAAAILDAVATRPGLSAGIASGGMRASASYKLSRIGVDAALFPASFSNDSITREGIAECAIARADGSFDDVVYVGDGPWDVETSALLGMRFVGIGGDAEAEKLYALGARVCLRDYSDPEAFFEAVRTTETPPRKMGGNKE